MFCRNCGYQLDGSENVCPKCGTPVKKVENNNAESTINSSNNSSDTITPVISSSAPVSNPTPAPVLSSSPAPEPAQQTMNNTNPPKKGNAAVIIIIVVLVGVLALGGIGIFVIGKYLSGFMNTQYTPDSPTSTPSTTTTTTGDATANKKTYGGYEFTIPNGFVAKIDSDYGLIINDDKIAFSLLADYSNSVSDYKNSLLKEYPTLNESDMKETINGRTYWCVNFTDANTGKKVVEYITQAPTGTATFVGLMFKKDGSEVRLADVDALGQLVDSAKVSGSSFSINDNDPGKDGIIDYYSKKLPEAFQ